MSIRLEQVSVREGDAAVLNDCTLTVAPGERFVLLGPEGAGKAALLRVIAGLCPLDHGRVLLRGRDVTRLPARLRGAAIVPSAPALFNSMSVVENIRFALGTRVPDGAERQRQADALLRMCAIETLAAQHPVRLSEAQRYRVAIARSLAHDPHLLLLDDPWAGLDLQESAELHAALDRARQRFGTTVLLTTTDPSAALRLADRIGVMSAGRVLETGEPDSLYLRPRTRFAARCLGDANFLPGHHGREGLRVGEQLFPHHEPASRAAPMGDVVVLVRPEDIALADAAGELRLPVAAFGQVERVEPAGQVQRLRVSCNRLGQPSGAAGDTSQPFTLLVTRPASAAREWPLVPGQQVAIGVRRVHELPTQLCSLWLLETAGGEASPLGKSGPVRALRAGMQVAPQRIDSRLTEGSLPATALCVASAWGQGGIDLASGVLGRGGRQVLLLREPDRALRQAVMLGQPSRAAREHMLGIGASLLRHLPMEAMLLVPDITRRIRGGRYRMLLDLRRMALERHGIDLRTEWLSGDVHSGLRARLRQAAGPVLLVLGLASPSAGQATLEWLGGVIDACPNVGAVLLTCARSATSPAASLAVPEHRAVA
jgi:sulfate/thiosulfate transport system ATP-binding protein